MIHALMPIHGRRPARHQPVARRLSPLPRLALVALAMLASGCAAYTQFSEGVVELRMEALDPGMPSGSVRTVFPAARYPSPMATSAVTWRGRPCCIEDGSLAIRNAVAPGTFSTDMVETDSDFPLFSDCEREYDIYDSYSFYLRLPVPGEALDETPRPDLEIHSGDVGGWRSGFSGGLADFRDTWELEVDSGGRGRYADVHEEVSIVGWECEQEHPEVQLTGRYRFEVSWDFGDRHNYIFYLGGAAAGPGPAGW